MTVQQPLSPPAACPVTGRLPGLDPETLADPYSYLAARRSEGPVFHDPQHDVYVLTRYDDIAFAERHPEIFSNAPAAVGAFRLEGRSAEEAIEIANQALADGAPPTLLTNDPPFHTPYRKLISRLMSRRRFDAQADAIRSTAHALLDRIEGTSFDIVDAYTRPLPVATVCRELGMPAGDEALFLEWSAMQRPVIGNPDVVAMVIAMAAENPLPNPVGEYFGTLIAQLREHPGDDLLSGMVHGEIEGRPLTDPELHSLLAHFLVAGHDTTTATMNTALHALLRDDALLDRVRRDPALIPAVVEEALRIEAPIQGLFRLVKSDVMVGEVAIPAGAMVLLSYAAANHDPAHFERPTEFDIDRSQEIPHLAFGLGVHFCVGAYLGRMQARIGLEVALERLAGLRLSDPDAEPHRVPSVVLRGLEALPVEVDAVLTAGAA